ncbi:hypothetical protein A2801_00915 [Candidatus Woesebacteria bacterium RIFCSPHIGHO2_01_FULL_41_10]|uniref:Uncharacterized protein n=1 Tax=Candidatus Woesebacteria bacterium RIFCSPHIGHO2_01_FULL_41_10 TaxID=1802500 RepID=A0A1F7YME8_9BACT|nr:MAG: hypothetical protein A2801_00915 [Candidatus Woesebacteria bacterium RIFCSPHIGHO2_01_FULL_41_10]
MGKHEEACPTIHPDSRAAIALYNTGWKHGRRGRQMQPQLGLHPTYRMGFGDGEVAAEEAYNGCSVYDLAEM